MFPLLRNAVLNGVRSLAMTNVSIKSSFHLISSPNLLNVPQMKLLTPIVHNVVPSCGFKVKGKLRRRCKHCYFVRREERLYIICEKHPRHKQMSMVKDPKNTWILSHATQSKVRPW